MNTNRKIRLLDLYCGAGLAAVGYHRAGFEIVGVDLTPQKHYPFTFIQADALSLNYEQLAGFDVIHASPPCQAYSHATVPARARGIEYPDLLSPTRAMLEAAGLPYVIENVQGAPMRRAIVLCGTMFKLGVFRHRLFESSIKLCLPETACTCKQHRIDDENYFSVFGDQTKKADAAAAMGVSWKTTKYGMAQGIPPAYTEFIGAQLMAHITGQPPAVRLREAEKLTAIRNASQYLQHMF